MQRLFFSTSMPVSFSLLLLLNSCMHNQGSSETSIAATHTRYAMSDSTSAPSHTNALIHESSPYLLQHAHNPVDWRAVVGRSVGRSAGDRINWSS